MAAPDVAPVKMSHARLRDTLLSLTASQARNPSLLPDWTVGHVLTHLARNADSFVGLLEAAAAGRVGIQYAGGNDQRAADIEAGAGRPVKELIADVVVAAFRLERAWAVTPDDVWRTGQGRVSSGLWPLADLPFRRWREVEMHHVDLGLDYGIDDWPNEYVDAELARALPGLPSRLPAGATVDVGRLDRRRLLAWIAGRGQHPDLPALTPWTG